MKVLRLWLGTLVFMASAAGLTGCDDGDGGGGKPSDRETGATAAADDEGVPRYDVTGNWFRPPWPAIYELHQSGNSVQGRYYEPNDDSVYGDIAGSVVGDYIEFDVAVHYLTHPGDNFTAHKEGPLLNRNHMVLTITGGPHFRGQVQDWYRAQ